jgi:Tfp pilus assembly protein PilP
MWVAAVAVLALSAGGWAQTKQQPAPKQPAKTAPAQPAPSKAPAPTKAVTPSQAAPAKPAPAKPAPSQAAPSKAAPPKVVEKEAVPPKAKAPVEALAAIPTQGGRRDPFEHLVSRPTPGGTGQPVPDRLPPGKGGLIVSSMRLDGVVKAPSGMIAVVSNPQRRVYFLREGDRLYDGRVERITLDGMIVREFGKDAFGKPLERIVPKRIYPSAGEPQ